MHKSSLRKMAELIAGLGISEGDCLDVGAADINGSYRNLVRGAGFRYEGIDRNPVGPDVTSRDIQWLPTDTYDLVISGQMFEHDPDPFVTAFHCRRVCRPGGWIIHIAPTAQKEHRYPVDCWRFMGDGMRVFAEGFNEVVAESEGFDAWVRAQKPEDYVDPFLERMDKFVRIHRG